MKREELIAMGISEENIEKIMADYGSSIQKANSDIASLREKASKAAELQERINELEAGNLTENEKNKKALEAANKMIADMQKKNAIRDQRESAMTNFKITADQAKSVVKDDGTFDYEILGKIISEKETAAAQAKEQEIAKNQDIPDAAGSDKKKAEKTPDALNAESITFGNPAFDQKTRNYYVI